MRVLPFLLLLPFLAACQNGAMPIDGQKLLSSLEGPKVPTMQDTMLESAKNAEKSGDFKSAATIYQQILEKQPDNREVTLALAESYRRGGDNDRAIALYDALLARDPSLLGAKEGKGLALMAKGDFDTPGTLFEEVMKADGTRWKTLNALGILFTTRNMHPEAQQYFNAALKQSPSNPSILNNLGLSQALSRNYPAATGSLMQASALTTAGSVDRKRVDLNMALVYAISGELPKAQAIAEQYFTGPVLNNNLGLYAHLAKDNELAKAYLNMALTDSKTFYEKAWDNLQVIGSTATTSPSAVPVVEAAPAANKLEPESTAEPEKKPEPKKSKTSGKSRKTKAKKPKEAEKPAAEIKATDDISNIVGATGEDPVKDSPIP